MVVFVNGAEVVSDRFDGIRPWRRTIDVSDRVYATGIVFELSIPGDTGQAFDLFAFEGFELSYLRAARRDLIADYDSLGQPEMAVRFRAEIADTASKR